MLGRGSGVRGGVSDRWGEPLKLLPVAFVIANIACLYLIYMTFHALPRSRDRLGYPAGRWSEPTVFNFVTIIMLICYARCILVSPGTVPNREDDPSWVYPLDCESEALAEASTPGQLAETKRSGERRHCKWCGKYKPDRCHHCRVCRACILKMDHHCPWIYNCVGFGNHKYFFLLFFYAVVDCHLICWTMLPTVHRAAHHETPFLAMFLVLFGETFAAFLGVLATPFFFFHVWLMLKAMTTIEFCEKALKRNDYHTPIYDRGMLQNVKSVLGENPIFWLLPICPPKGDGLSFQTEEVRHIKDIGDGRSLRRRTHNASGVASAKPPRLRVKAAGTGAPPTPGQSDESAEDLGGLSAEDGGDLSEESVDAWVGPGQAALLPAKSKLGK